MKVSMNLKAKKLELVQLILNTDKPALLEKDKDWWNEISESERKAIEESLAEADDGQLIPHAKVMEEVRAKYKLD